ncbi:histidine-containing phosphotransfer protein 1-like [Mangifera indica]|uniref:histidine-containing phosphotransfer protein 1-like n=1 Tax=Mangifera indica TaxID=29780 RepID=UPI001CF967EA|nr:histidine-containing phosphotransfer protein 1-like [Mangifera indica]
METIPQLQKKLIDYQTSLFNEGILDAQFNQLKELQDENNPDFVVEVVTLFFQDTERLLTELAQILDQQIIDFNRLDAYVHQLKGSSSSIGAQRVQTVCILFRQYCQEKNIGECLKCLQQLKQEYYSVKNKLETLFKLEKQVQEAGGTIRVQ